MKKLTLLFIAVFLSCFLQAQTLYVTYQYSPMGAGLFFEAQKFAVNPVVGIDFGKEVITKFAFTENPLKGEIQQIKASVGISTPILEHTNDCKLILTGNYTHLIEVSHTEFFELDKLYTISFSIGFSLNLTKNIKLFANYDVLNREPKTGIGITFKTKTDGQRM